MANGLMEMLMPSEDDALKRAIMAAGFGLLGTRKGQETAGLGRAGLLGMGVYENSMQNQLQNNSGKLALAQHIAKMQADQQAAKQQQEAMDALAGMPGGAGPVAGPAAAFQQPGGASALMSGAMGGQTPPAAQLATQMAAPTDDPSAQKMAQANYLEEVFRKTKNPTAFLMAQKLREEAMKMRDENQGFETVMGPDGKPMLVQRRKYGAPQQIPYGPKPDITMQDLGGSVQAIDRLRTQAGQVFPKTMDPAQIDASKRGWAQYALSANADKRAAAGVDDGKWTNDLERGIQVNARTGESRPITEAGQPIGNKAETKAKQSAGKIMAIVAEAEKYLDSATGSYGGAALDQGARIFGSSTEGATAIARLQALEGALMLNQPRMEGPQSDKDTAIYKQMAGRIGDPTVPTTQKRAALEVIKNLNQRYADVNAASFETEFARMPSGTIFTAPDGTKRRKP